MYTSYNRIYDSPIIAPIIDPIVKTTTTSENGETKETITMPYYPYGSYGMYSSLYGTPYDDYGYSVSPVIKDIERLYVRNKYGNRSVYHSPYQAVYRSSYVSPRGLGTYNYNPYGWGDGLYDTPSILDLNPGSANEDFKYLYSKFMTRYLWKKGQKLFKQLEVKKDGVEIIKRTVPLSDYRQEKETEETKISKLAFIGRNFIYPDKFRSILREYMRQKHVPLELLLNSKEERYRAMKVVLKVIRHKFHKKLLE